MTNLRPHPHPHNNDFDVLLFTQQWPAVFCYEWMNSNPDHTCKLPSPKEIWTIHGIWPTKFGTMGPFNCNSTWVFDANQIARIRSSMEQFWINIENGTPFDNLWRHEWSKHGTCAAVIKELNSEEKYFGQGLTWLQQYSMSSILAQANIVPDTSFGVLHLQTEIEKILKVHPVIHCVYDVHDQKHYLSEIRICFNKTLDLVDCDGVVGGTNEHNSTVTITYPGGKVITNCDLTKPIYYPSTVPPTKFNQNQRKTEWKFPFVNFYKLIQMIKWVTL